MILLTWPLSVTASEPFKPVFICDEYPPFNYINDENELVGSSVDVLKEIMKRMGQELSREDIILLPWARAYQLFQQNPAAVLFSMVRSAEREAKFHFVGPIATSKLSLFSNQATLEINQVTDLSSLKVGVVRNGIGEQLLNKLEVDQQAQIKLPTPMNW